MSGDLFTLRMIVVSDLSQHRQIWREAAGLASVPIDFFEADAASACPLLSKGNLDILMLDSDVKDSAAAINAARALSPRPVIAVASPTGGKIDGADAVVPKPKNAEEARALVERCIRMRMPKRVLIVDDSRTMRGIVRKILAGSRYALDVSEAEEGLTALNSIDRGVDLVLLDYNMPGFNGFETLNEIKRLAPHVHVVMMTSAGNDALVVKAEASGAAGFLKKPFYPSDIDAVMDMIYEPPAR